MSIRHDPPVTAEEQGRSSTGPFARGGARHPTRRAPVSTNSSQRSVLYKAAARLLMDSLDYESTLAAVAGLALPDIGSWSIVDLYERSGSMRRLAIVHPDAEMQKLTRRLVRSWPPQSENPHGAPVAMRTGETQVVSRVSDAMLIAVARDKDDLTLLRKLGIGSYVVVPLTARRQVLGAITFVSRMRGRTYTEDDLGLAEDLAALGALAIERANVYEESQSARSLATDRAEVAERQQRDLEQIMEVQARLVRGFSHDVRNPLGAAQGYALLLEEEIIDTLTARQKQSVRQIGASIHSALALIDDLVEYAKSKMGNVKIERSLTNVGELAEEILEEYRAQIEAAGLGVQFEVPWGLAPIRSDRARIRQILGNLISNALKYTEHGVVSVRVEAHPHGAPWPGGWIAVAVADTGHGIPQEHQRLIFQEFARLEPTTTQGSGLGLAISEWMAESLGARITLSSKPGLGSTFTLWLPLQEPITTSVQPLALPSAAH
jgi:signal transduction histidine kinase